MDPRNRHRHHLSATLLDGRLETAGPGCYDAVAIARTAGFRMLDEPASVMRRLSLNRSDPAKKSGQNIPKNRCQTTIAERMGETPAELPFIGDQVSRPAESHRRALAGRVEDWRAGFRPMPCHVSSPRHVERSVRISRTALPHLLHVEAYWTYPAGATFGLSRRTR